MIKLLNKKLFDPIDPASLITFRILGGFLIGVETLNYFFLGAHREYIDPQFHFTYTGFSWVQPLGSTGVYIHLIIVIISAWMCAAGLFYRISSIVLFVSHTAMFLMEKTQYINHAYLYCLLSLLFVILPLHRVDSLDTKRKPEIRWTAFPRWMLLIILVQMAAVYIYAAVAKYTPDWFEARSLKIWLPSHAGSSPLGSLLKESWLPGVMSKLGFVFDLVIVGLMIFRKTRILGLICAAMFHFTNVLIFGLATFPWMSILLTAMFLKPSWPRKLPVISRWLKTEPKEMSFSFRPIIVVAFWLFALIQLVVPARHYFLEENVAWTENYHKFSWRMMLRAKSGNSSFFIVDKSTNARLYIDQREYLTRHQIHSMSGKPEMILEFAHFLGEVAKSRGIKEPAIYVKSYCSLNGRPSYPLVREDIDLLTVKIGTHSEDYTVPLPKT